MSDDRQAELFNLLRASTAELLGYDVDHLTAAQEIRVGRAITLRLIVDDLQARSMQARSMRGEMIDVKAFVVASENLERMVGGQPDAPAIDNFADAKEELNRLLDQRADAIAARDETLRNKIATLTEENAKLQAKLGASEQSPERPYNVVPIDGAAKANSNLPPLHYLKEGQKREPWERYHNGNVTDGPHAWPLPE